MKGGPGGPFTVQPESWDIPPHEHRYVSVYFNPSEIKTYRAVFFAEVDDEGSTSTSAAKRQPIAGSGTSMIFDLGGSGMYIYKHVYTCMHEY
jgi:hydrocephalus-inducing protein